MQAGKNIAAFKIASVQDEAHTCKCFGGNGIRGFVEDFNRSGDFPLIGRQGALCGNINRATGEFYATEHAVVVNGFGLTDVSWQCFMLTALNLNQYATATAQPGLAVSKIVEVLAPIPPLVEQRRIVERVERLMPLVEEYGRLEDEREELDTSLTDRLHKSVLHVAVQGKLIAQDPLDEPASELLERIREERRQLIAEKKLKVPKGGESIIYRASDGGYYEKRIDAKGRESEPVCIDEEIPFEIPESWEWCRLGSLCNYGQCTNVEYSEIDDGTWVLELEDIEKDTGRYIKKSRKNGGIGSIKHTFVAGNILYSKLRPYLNKVVIADEDGAATSEILPLDFLSLVDLEYAQLALMTPMFLDYADKCSYGIKMPRLGTADGCNALIPIPPLNEQQRIVQKSRKLIKQITR